MQNIVVDSSVIVKWINRQNEQNIAESDNLLSNCKKGLVQLYTTELAKYEIGNVLWKKGLDSDQAKTSLSTVYAIPIEFIKLGELEALQTIEIAISAKMTFYDASYVSLAENIGAILVTDNPKHQSKYKNVKTISLANYK